LREEFSLFELSLCQLTATRARAGSSSACASSS